MGMADVRIAYRWVPEPQVWFRGLARGSGKKCRRCSRQVGGATGPLSRRSPPFRTDAPPNPPLAYRQGSSERMNGGGDNVVAGTYAAALPPGAPLAGPDGTEEGLSARHRYGRGGFMGRRGRRRPSDNVCSVGPPPEERAGRPSVARTTSGATREPGTVTAAPGTSSRTVGTAEVPTSAARPCGPRPLVSPWASSVAPPPVPREGGAAAQREGGASRKLTRQDPSGKWQVLTPTTGCGSTL